MERAASELPSPSRGSERGSALVWALFFVSLTVGILVAHVAVPLLDAEWAHKTSEQGGPLAVAVDPPQAPTPRAQTLSVRAPT